MFYRCLFRRCFPNKFAKFLRTLYAAPPMAASVNANFVSHLFTIWRMVSNFKVFFSNCDQIPRKLQIALYLLKKSPNQSLMENSIFLYIVRQISFKGDISKSYLFPKSSEQIPVNSYLFKICDRNTRERCETNWNLTIKKPEWHHWTISDGVCIINF